MQDHKIDDILPLQKTHVNTNSTEVLKGHAFVYSTSITDEQRKQAETNRTREVNKGKGRGRGKGQAALPHPPLKKIMS
jgi:cobyrinic acid a,c-diamide synthase